MTIELLRVLLLQAEDDLNGDQTSFGRLEFQIGIDGDLRRVLVDMRSDGFTGNHILRDSILVDSHRSENGEGSRIDLGPTVRDDTDDNCGFESALV